MQHQRWGTTVQPGHRLGLKTPLQGSQAWRAKGSGLHMQECPDCSCLLLLLLLGVPECRGVLLPTLLLCAVLCCALTPPQVYGTESLQHPYSYVLFLGQDARGDMLPCRQLRDKYGARRRDVYKPGSEPSEEGEGDEEGGDGEGRGGGGGGNGGAGPKGSGGGGGGGRVVIPGIDMSSLDDA